MSKWSTVLWRRCGHTAGTDRWQVMESNGVVLDGPRRRVHVDGYVVHLSARETAVLGVLMARTGRVVYRPSLAIAAWGTTQVDHRVLDRLLGRLRRRIEPSPVSPTRLRRIDDAGYIFGSAH
jgi:DNA-binding response OmpR family regulator